MATNKQRRDAERLRLQRQLEERRRREAARKRVTLIASIVGTLIVIAAVVITVVATSGSDDKPAKQAGGEDTKCTDVAKVKGAVTFDGVTVQNPTNLKKDPKVCSAGTTDPTALKYKDLVVGKGATPALTSNVEVQYVGLTYKTGTQFDSSWARGGQATPFNLQQVVAGYTQGIGGNSAAKIPPMKVGGRRIVVLPSALGYGATGNQGAGIAPNTALVFVIDLTKVAAA